MRASHLWSDQPPPKDDVRLVCYSVCFSPDGEFVVAGVGSRVHVYRARAGMLMHTLKGHKDAIYATAYAADGLRFASGGADKTVIVWSKDAVGLLKFSHTTPVHCLAYNPVTQQLASGATDDIGLWHPEQSSVQKTKVHARVLSVMWSTDGMVLAVGHEDGVVTLRDKAGAEKQRLQRDAPVWGFAWAPEPTTKEMRLCVADWDHTLSLYAKDGTLLADVAQDAAPNCLAPIGGGELVAVGSSNKKVTLSTPDGRKLNDLVTDTAWVWGVAAWTPPKPEIEPTLLAVGSESGQVSVYEIESGMVHSIFRARHAFREGMTTVQVRHLVTGARLAIRCSSFVQRVSVFQDRLAVQMQDRVSVYDLGGDALTGVNAVYKKRAQINRAIDCDLMLVTSANLLLCLGAKLQSLGFDDQLQREWAMDAPVKYIKVLGGKPGQEGLLLGLANGQVQQVFLNNPFPVDIIQHSTCIRCLDMSLNRTRVAVVDTEAKLVLVDASSKTTTLVDTGVHSAVFNSEMDNMLCYTTGTHLCVKAGSAPVVKVPYAGMVVNSLGRKAFILKEGALETTDLPISAVMAAFVDASEFDLALEVARLGVPRSDWRALAERALVALETEVARRAYQRLRDVAMLEVVAKAERMIRKGDKPLLVKAECLAGMGEFDRAAEAFKAAGAVQNALQMFGDLRQFERAQAFVEQSGEAAPLMQQLVMKQADWSEQTRDWGSAARMYVQAGKPEKALHLLARHKAWEDLMELVTTLDRREHSALLELCAQHFLRAKEHTKARDTLIRLGDMKGVALVHVETHNWADAFRLLEQFPELQDEVLVPYARFLAAHDRFDEARLAYKRAGRSVESSAVLTALLQGAVVEQRFSEAAYYSYTLSLEYLEGLHPPGEMVPEDRRLLESWARRYAESEMYYAYTVVQQAEDEPFRTVTADVIFNAARYLYMKLSASRAGPPQGIMVSKVLMCIARTAHELGANKLARAALERLNELRLSPMAREAADAMAMRLKSRPMEDPEEMQPVCYRCGAVNPLLNTQGDFCSHCSSPFVRSFITFEHLPVVEFELEPGISDEEALRLLEEEPPEDNVLARAKAGGEAAGRELREGNADMLRLDQMDEDVVEMAAGHMDPFTSQRDLGAPILCDRDVLRALKRSEVLVRTWPSKSIPAQYFRVMDDDTPLCVGPCGHFFERDECELRALETGTLPFSKLPLRGRSIPVDRFHEDTEWKGGEDKLMRGVEGYGTGAGGKKEGKGWRAVKSWQPEAPAFSMGQVVEMAQARQGEIEMESLGVIPAEAS